MRGRTTSKSSLFLMELIIVILLFSVCAAVCLQVFAFAETTANNASNVSNAVLAAQSVAECYRASDADAQLTVDTIGGIATQTGEVSIFYDEHWQRMQAEPRFELQLKPSGDYAEISVQDTDNGETLYTLQVRLPKEGGV